MTMSVIKNRTAALAAGIAFAVLSGPALAADAIGEEPPAPPAAPVYEEAPAGWEGAYLGVTGSYSAGEASHSQPVPKRIVPIVLILNMRTQCAMQQSRQMTCKAPPD